MKVSTIMELKHISKLRISLLTTDKTPQVELCEQSLV